MTAMITLLYLGTECGGAARADVSECLALLGRQYMVPAFQEFLTALSEDIGDFQPMGVTVGGHHPNDIQWASVAANQTG